MGREGGARGGRGGGEGSEVGVGGQGNGVFYYHKGIIKLYSPRGGGHTNNSTINNLKTNEKKKN